MEQQNIYEMGAGQTLAEKAVTFKQRDAIPIPTFNCPSRRPGGPYPNIGLRTRLDTLFYTSEEMARSDYAANVGDERGYDQRCGGIGPRTYALADDPAPSNNPNLQWPPAMEPTDVVKGYSGIVFCGSKLGFINLEDGVSNTYAIGERAINPDHMETGEALNDDWSMYSGFQDDIAASVWYQPSPNGGEPRQANQPIQDTPGFEDRERFGSAHPGGFNISFCDGSVQFISYDIDHEVHRQNGHRADAGLRKTR